MALHVVGWGCPKGEMCQLCYKNRATIYVADTRNTGRGMTPACNSCVPPGYCPDPIADIFARVLEKASANQNEER